MVGLMRKVLVTGTDTDVGKTYVSTLLLKDLRKSPVKIGAYKPACSGSILDDSGNEVWNDIQMLSAASGISDLDLICPQKFTAALAPNVAAKQQNSSVSGQLLYEGVERWQDKADLLLIEGVGGFVCPLSDCVLLSDFAERLACEVIIVAANRLGVLNHTLLTVEAVRNRNLKLLGIVLNDVNAESDQSAATNLRQLHELLPDVPITHCGFQSKQLSLNWFAGDS